MWVWNQTHSTIFLIQAAKTGKVREIVLPDPHDAKHRTDDQMEAVVDVLVIKPACSLLFPIVVRKQLWICELRETKTIGLMNSLTRDNEYNCVRVWYHLTLYGIPSKDMLYSELMQLFPYTIFT